MGFFIIWIFFWVVTPYITSRSPAMTRYINVQDEYNLKSSALYYTDVPVTLDAVRDNLDSFRRETYMELQTKLPDKPISAVK